MAVNVNDGVERKLLDYLGRRAAIGSSPSCNEVTSHLKLFDNVNPDATTRALEGLVYRGLVRQDGDAYSMVP